MRDFQLESIPEARGLLMTNRIVVGALAMGVVMFGGIAVTIALTTPEAPKDLPIVSFIMGFFGAIVLVMSFIVPGLIAAQSRKQIRSESTESKARSLLTVFATKTLIGCALCEGGALGNLVAFIVEQQWWSLGIVGVLLLAILSRFPTQAGIENFVREQIELAEMEQGRG